MIRTKHKHKISYSLTKTAIHLVFVNNLHCIVSDVVQEFAASYHSVVFAVKKDGVARPMRKFAK